MTHKDTCATVEYSDQDERNYASWLHDQDIYRRTWPKHCEKCRGWGAFVETYDPSPQGVSLGSGWMEDYAQCVECLELEQCPRCAGPAPFVDGVGVNCCTQCGFVEGKTEGIADPPHPAECDCWEYPPEVTS